MRVLEEENRKLKQLVADLSLDKQMLQDVLQKKGLKPAQFRPHGEVLQVCYGVSERRVCQVLQSPRSTHRYRSVPDGAGSIEDSVPLCSLPSEYHWRPSSAIAPEPPCSVNAGPVRGCYKQRPSGRATIAGRFSALCYQVSMYGCFFSVRGGTGGRRLSPLAIHDRVSAGSITSSTP